MDLRAIIDKYDFLHGTVDAEAALESELSEIDEDEFCNTLNKRKLDGIVSVYIQKVCIKGYPVTTSKPYWMAYTTLMQIQDVMEYCVENRIVEKVDAQDIMFELYCELIRCGPGTSHCELIRKLVKRLDMDQYIERIYGEKLVKAVDALNQLSYIRERVADKSGSEVSMEDHSGIVAQCVVPEVRRVIGSDVDRTKATISENQRIFVELYYFYLVQMTKLPVEYLDLLEECQVCIVQAYDRTMYKGLQDAVEVRRHLDILDAFLYNERFTQYEQLQRSFTRTVGEVVKLVESSFVLEVWEDLVKYMKIFCTQKNIRRVPDVPKELRNLVTKMDDKHLRANPKLFEIWAPAMCEILKEGKRSESMTEMIGGHVWQMKEKVKPAQSGHDKLWIPILLGLIKWPWQHTYQAAERLLKESKWKRSWNWKENLDDAKEVLMLLCLADLPMDEESWETRDIISSCGNIVAELLDQLEIIRMNDSVQEELLELFFTVMRRKSGLQNSISKETAEKLNFEENRELIPMALRRFEKFLRDEEFPWTDESTRAAGLDFMQKCVGAFDDGSEFHKEVTQRIVGILMYVMESGKKMVDVESGDLNFFGSLLCTALKLIITKHRQTNTLKKMEPLVPLILELLDREEHEELKPVLMDSFSLMYQKAGESLAPSIELLIKHYLRTSAAQFLQCMIDAYDYNPGPIPDKFEQLVDVFIEDKELYTVHAIFLTKAAELQPEMFTADVLQKLMEHHFMDTSSNPQMLLMLEILAEKNPAVLVPYLEDKLYNNSNIMPAMGSVVVRIISLVAVKLEEHKTSAFDYFLNSLKESSEETQMLAMLYGLRELANAYGNDMFTSHKEYLEDLRENGSHPSVQDSAADLCEVLEGKRLQKVSQDLQRQKQQHTNDLERRSNVPEWSEDVSKLMNPEAEDDWRMLASRLGYSDDDIRVWAIQSYPCMALLGQWYATQGATEATQSLLEALQGMNRVDAAAIVENAMKRTVNVVPDEQVDHSEVVDHAEEPPQIFLSYQREHQNEVKLLRTHLVMAGYTCWMDNGQMDSSDDLIEKIKSEIQRAKVIVPCVTEKYAESAECIQEVNMAVDIGKPVVTLLLEKMDWPPAGSLEPVFRNHLFIRFHQRPGEETEDERFWPAAKFLELLMQFSCLDISSNESKIVQEYKMWWKSTDDIPQEDSSSDGATATETVGDSDKSDSHSPDVFISYQWGSRKEALSLYQRLTTIGCQCWLDLHQMVSGDSLYAKIDKGIKGSKVVLSLVTPKYALSINCSREVSLADTWKKPIIPMLMEKMEWPPIEPISKSLTKLNYVDFTKDDTIRHTWRGEEFDELSTKIKEYMREAESDTSNEIRINGTVVPTEHDIYDGRESRTRSRENGQLSRTSAPAEHDGQPSTNADENQNNNKSSTCVVL